MNTKTDTIALAREALYTEGIDAYFPGIDITPDNAITLLARYLDLHPHEWTPATSESAWTFNGDLDYLASYVDTSQ